MRQFAKRYGSSGALLPVVLVATSLAGETSNTAFTYQGQLKQDGVPVNDTCDFQFTLWNSPTSRDPTDQVGPTINFSPFPTTKDPIEVVDGLFSATLDFGAESFNGGARYLQVGVRCPSTTELIPLALLTRQLVTATPYAVQTRGIVVDDLDNVGIGTASPNVKLDVVGDTEIDGNLAVSSSAFVVKGDLTVDNSTLVVDAQLNRVGIGTSSPGEALSVNGVVSVTSNASALGQVRITRPQGTPGFVAFSDAGWRRDIRFYDSGIALLASTTALAPGATDGIRISSGGNVGIQTSSNLASLNVADGGNNFGLIVDGGVIPALIGREGDGPLLYFHRNGSPEGVITVTGSTVSYSAFTGSHYVWTNEDLEPGWLLTLTGNNRRGGAAGGSEIRYGAAPSVVANNPRCAGAFLGVTQPREAPGPSNPHLMAAVGNGDMWVVETGRNLEPGDLLISSDVRGHAMLDDAKRFPTGYVVARVAEPVDWSNVSETVEGLKHRKVSVFFESFVRTSTVALANQLAAQQEQILALQAEVAALKDAVRKMSQSCPAGLLASTASLTAVRCH